MSKNIIICVDGTWNEDQEEGDENTETNVRNLFEMCLNDNDKQIAYYDQGVGSKWWNRIRGGIFGRGLSQNIREAYLKLAEEYEIGDKVFIFGFSRGAYTARSLIGFTYSCGLLPRNEADEDNVEDIFDIYEDGSDEEKEQCKKSKIICPIEMIGVWDTVGALGIPLNLFSSLNKNLFQFHDTTLNPEVKAAYHALAIDEQREAFEPSLWDEKNKSANQIMEQIWFAGVHSDVGGGYVDRSHSDIAFNWMLERAVKRHGMKLKDNHGYELKMNPKEDVHDSYRIYYGSREPRKIPKNAKLHCSVLEKMRQSPDYKPLALSYLKERETLKPYTVVEDDL